eukprot:TRINITY_DN6795_c0_g1_i1.p1 TRINITY_DN6795_c0_g1~~TRINITY_DN6795_c0_g1_i1.p1  ORF type:complete len:1718 (+),score=476.95 TRINITY_DN6795_c0_g1_i1:188-5341(+)
MSKLAVGARVSVKDKEEEYGPGVVRFVGATKFATGDWVGIELDSPNGKNDGSVADVKYFTCKPKHGVFIKTANVVMWDAYMAEKTKKSGGPAPAAAAVTSPSAKKIASPTPAKATAASAKVAAATTPSPTPSSPSTPEPAKATPVSTPAPTPASAPATPVPSTEDVSKKIEEAVRAAVEQEKSASAAKIEEMTAEFSKKEKEYTTALEKFTFHLQSLTTKNKDLEASVEEYKTKADDLTSLLEEATLKEEVLTEEIEEARKTALEEAKTVFERQLGDKQKEIDDLKSAVAAAGDSSKSIAELAESASKLAAARQELETARVAHEEAILALKQEKAQVEAVASGLQKQVNSLSQELDALKESSSAADSGAQQLQAETSDLKKQVSALSQQLEEAQSQVAALKDAASASAAGAQGASQEVAALRIELESVRAQVSAATKAQEQAESEVQKLKTQLASSEENAASASSSHEAALNSLQSQLTQTEEKYSALVQSSEARVKELQELLATAEKKSTALSASHADSVSSLEKRILDLTNELKAATSGAGDAEKQLRDELNEKRSRLDALESELSQLSADRQAALDDAEAAKSELAIQKELLEDVELKLQDAQTRLSEAELSHEDELDKVQKELGAAHKKAEELRKQVQALEEKASQAAAIVAPAPTTDDTVVVALRAELDQVKAKFEDQIASLTDQLEMATVDKELAEGQFEESQREIASLKELMSQLQATAQQSAAAVPEPVVPTPVIASPSGDVDAAALAQQNMQLTEALLQLKTFAESSQAELQRLQGDVLPNLEIAKATLEEKVLDYEDRLEALKASVEDAASLQEKFQDIFEQKMDLEEELRSAKETLADLQALRDLADETEENHQALEKRLQSELYSKQVEVLDKEGVIANMNLVLEERSQTIERLERFLNELQLIRQRDAEAAAAQTGAESSPVQGEEQSRESEELAVLLRQQASREAVKALQDSLHDLDMQQAILQNRLFRLFVPEGAIKADQEASSLLLLMKRIAFKSNLSALNLHRQFSMDRFERNIDQQDEFNRFVWSLEQLVFRFEYNASQIVDALRECDEDTYSRLAKLLYEVAPYEKKIDNILSLIQSENIRLNQPPLDDLSITLERFDFLCDKFVPKSLVSPSRVASTSIRSLMFDSRSIIYLVKQCIGPTSAASAFGVSDDRFKMLQELCRKLIRLLVSASPQNAVDYILRDIQQLPSDVVESITGSSKLIAMILSAVASAAQQFAKISTEDPSKVSNPRSSGNLFEDLIRDALSKNENVADTLAAATKLVESRASHVVGSPQNAICVLDKYYDVVFKLLSAFEEELSRGVHDVVAEPTSSTPSTPVKTRPSSDNPPALTPSKRIGDTLAEASLGVCSRLEEHAFNIRRDLESTLDIKSSSAGVKKELAERDAILQQRNKTIEDLEWKVKKTEHRVSQIERELEEQTGKADADKQKALSREKTLEEQLLAQTRQTESASATVKQLQEQLSKLEVENQVLQQTAGVKQEEHASAVSSEQVNVLREAIAFLTQENQRLRAIYDKQRLVRDLPPLAVATPASSILSASIEARKAMVSALSDTLAQGKSVEPAVAAVAPTPASSARKVSQALTALISTVALPKAIDLSDATTSPVDQLKTINLQYRKLHRAATQIQSEASQVLVTGQFISRETLAKQLKDATASIKAATPLGGAPVARVTLPDQTTGAKVCVSKADLESLHSSLISMNPIH